MAKGIRVNLLAKELNVESKAILAKLRDEGIVDTTTGAPFKNHMAVLALGLAESVREWFSHSGGNAVETAAPVETGAKARSSRSRKKKADGDESESGGDEGGTATAVAEAPPVEERVVIEPPPSAAPPEVETVTVVVPEAPPAPPARPKVAPKVEAPVVPETPAYVAPPVAAAAPAPVAAPPPPVAPMAPAPRGPSSGPTTRPTVTLADRLTPTHKPVRAAITPAPQLLQPKPAQIQGPRVVREEAPENLPAPRRKLISDAPGPGFTTARPATGRGVKVEDEEEEMRRKAAAKKGGSLSTRRRGVDGRRGEALEKLKEFTDADRLEREERLRAAATYRTGFDSHLKKSESRGTHAPARTTVEKGEPVDIEEPITVKTLAAALGVKSQDVVKKLMSQSIYVTNVNQTLDSAIAGTMALEYGIELHIAQRQTLEQQLLAEFEEAEKEPSDERPRPPVVTILGHVDHGKTSLLDKIRSANVAAGEAGGITQHTAAWMVEIEGGDKKKKRVTFIDTPGHQAFTSMRARGANMTDVVVLVVSAAEGVQPQTIESINHARAAGVPIVVAMNKIDRPDAQPDMVLGQLAGQGLNPVEWGGDTEVIRTSAITGAGIKELIEILDYQAELLELKADWSMPARGIVIESRVDAGLGSVATVLIQNGTLNIGDIALSGPGYGRIRMLLDDHLKPLEMATPSMPIIVSGLSSLPSAGDKIFVVDDIERARMIAAERSTMSRQEQLASQNRVTNAGNLLDTMAQGDISTINLIIKGDVQGSVETLVKTVGGQNTAEVQVKVIHSGVGAINESDVELAMATRINPVDSSRPRKVAIIGFHVVPDDSARALAEQNHIDVKTYKVIYEIFDDLKKALSGLLSKEVREKIHGHAEIRQVFKVSRLGNIAGCMVLDGHIVRTDKIRLIRDGKVITDGLSLESLKRVKEDAKEVKSGFECGIKVSGYDDIKIGDRFEAYITEEFERTL